VAEERGEYRGSDFRELHHTGDDHGGQRVNLPSCSYQLGWVSDEQCGDLDRERSAGGASDHHTAGKSDRDGGTDGDVHSGGDGHRAASLPVAEEWGEHRGGDILKLHDYGDDHFRQRIDV
jgi:hypothetical protein